jgi:hypothetical protein
VNEACTGMHPGEEEITASVRISGFAGNAPPAGRNA